MDYHKFTLRNSLLSEKDKIKLKTSWKKSQGRKLEFNPLYMGNPKRVLFLTVKTQMKCSIMLLFIRVYTENVKKVIRFI